MIIFKTIASLQQWVTTQKLAGLSIGFVPTMGALHLGHLSLIDASKNSHSLTVCSIFVNPTQFNDPRDYEKYPITIERDCELLETQQADVLFLPSVSEMYPNGNVDKQHYDLGTLESVLDGAYRPGHFQGVCQVVERLLTIVQPHGLFLGQKDFQQCMVLQKLVAIMASKNSEATPIQITVVPTLRDADGLAMSSRNMRLTPTQRSIAPAIYQQLLIIKQGMAHTPFDTLLAKATQNLLAAGFTKVDYVTIANATTLEIGSSYRSDTKWVALIAAFINDIRLIDNMLLNNELAV